VRLRNLVSILCLLITTSISQALPPFTPNSVAFSLNPSGRSHIGWCFGDNSWTWTAGSAFHFGDDTYADDWNRDGTSCDQDRGWPVYATFPGTVIFTGNASNGFGNQVIIRSSQNTDFAMRFAHLDDISVSLNQAVTFSTLIGHTGDTGTDCVHLHDVLYKNITQLNSSGVAGLSRLQGGHYPQGNTGSATVFAADFYMDGIESAPNPPVVQSPADYAVFTDSNNNIQFTWSVVSGAPYYEIWIDNLEGFGSPEIGFNNGASPYWQNNGIVSTNSFSLTPQMQLGMPQNAYFWRVRALNSANSGDELTGWSVSPYRRFNLLDCSAPAQVSGVSATDNLCNSVTISWTDVANETGYRIMRHGIEIGTVGSNTTSYSDGTATPGVTYTYTVQAYNACGNGPLSNADTGIRLAAPGTVTGVVASDNLCPTVSISWSNIANETGYRIRRSGVVLTTVSADITSYADNTATPGLLYSYTVQAYNTCGDGPESSPDNGTRASAPNQVTGVSATDGQCANVVVTWNNASWETGYYVYRNGLGPEYVGADITTYVDNSANPGTVYSYIVAAYNSCGAGPQSNPDNGFKAVAPALVTGLVASDDLCDDIVVTWNDVTGEDGYLIFQNMVQTTSVPANVTSYTDPNMPPGQYYFYAVKAFNSCGAGGFSNEDVGRVMPAPVQVLGVTASDDDCEGVLVTWLDQADEQAYYVYRDGSSIGTVPPDVTSFFDEYTMSGESHLYTVAAGTSCTTGPQSASDTGVRLLAAPAPSACNATEDDCSEIIVTWTDNSTNELGFNIYRDGVLADAVGANIEVYVDAPVPGSYAYTVKAFSDCGESAASNSDSGMRLGVPQGPPNCQASDTSCAGITITWIDVSDNETGFDIYRDGQWIGSTTANVVTYFDDNPTGTYLYSVAAINNCGASSHSESDQGTRLTGATPPSNCQASDTSCAMIMITWTDNSNNENRFYIYRNGLQIGFVNANVTSYYLFSGFGSHSFQVRANNIACGLSQPSDPDSGSFLTIPNTPMNMTASDTSVQGIYLSWIDFSSNETAFDIYRDYQLIGTVPSNMTSHFDSPGDHEPHEYCVLATNQCGESDSICDFGQVLVGLSSPEELVLKYDGVWLWLNWRPLRDGNGVPLPNIIYSLHRGDEPEFSPSELTYVASTMDTVYLDLPLSERGFYRVVAELP